ncbi:hypothetical protein AB6A40_010152 [Gnathostoma spinigerum]|uniref:Serpin domain-containing protein n=1 Tax=Gnathostoma spinigerum TaxID=75299 RepID=A0ABD6F180_9BILA
MTSFFQFTHENTNSEFDIFGRDGKALASYGNRLPFQGVWTVPIPPRTARAGQFHLADGSTKIIEFVDFEYEVLYGETDSAKVLALEFERTFDAKMFFILPKNESKFTEVQKELSGTSLLDLNQTVKPQAVNVQIPLFEIETSYSGEVDIKDRRLKHPKNLLGSLISSHLDGAKVKYFGGTTYFQVTEWGATGKGFEPAGPIRSWKRLESIETKYEFTADHPFLFAVTIRGIVLFLGRFGG